MRNPGTDAHAHTLSTADLSNMGGVLTAGDACTPAPIRPPTKSQRGKFYIPVTVVAQWVHGADAL